MATCTAYCFILVFFCLLTDLFESEHLRIGKKGKQEKRKKTPGLRECVCALPKWLFVE